VVATIVLYYQLYVAGAVAPSILQHYGMTFRYYVYGVGVVAAAVGAFAAILAGLSDRWGRANMVTYGLALVALLTFFAVPNAPTKCGPRIEIPRARRGSSVRRSLLVQLGEPALEDHPVIHRR
jgi:MFS family permease